MCWVLLVSTKFGFERTQKVSVLIATLHMIVTPTCGSVYAHHTHGPSKYLRVAPKGTQQRERTSVGEN